MSDELIPPAMVGRVRLVAVAAATGALLLSLWFRRWPGRSPLDAVVDPALVGGLGADHRLLWSMVLLGDPTVMVGAAVVCALGAVVARRWRGAALAVIGPVATAGLTEFVLRPAVGRTRDGDLAFPSGHTVTITAIATVLTVLVAGGGRPRREHWRRVAYAVVWLVPLGVALSLVALGLHFTTDTVGGGLVAVAVVLLVALAIDAAVRRDRVVGGVRSSGRGP